MYIGVSCRTIGTTVFRFETIHLILITHLYRATLYHWSATLVRSIYPSRINKIGFICYAKYCHQKMRGVLVLIVRLTIALGSIFDLVTLAVVDPNCLCKNLFGHVHSNKNGHNGRKYACTHSFK